MSQSDSVVHETGNTLLVTPPWNEDVDRPCLERVTDCLPGERDVVVVSYARPAEIVIDDWLAHLGERPRNLGVVDLEDAMRSAVSIGEPPRGPDPTNVAVSLPDHGDVSSLLDVVERFLSDWDANDGPSVAYVDSVTGMIHRIGLAATIGFVDALGTLLSSGERTGFFRLDDGAHDDRTLNMLDPLFDHVLGLTREDGWSWSELPSAAVGAEAGQTVASSRPANAVFDLLANRRRRLLLHGLRLVEPPASLQDLAAFVARREAGIDGEPTDDAFSRTYTALWHVHLPALQDVGVVAFDETDDTVELVDPRPVEPYLSMTAMEDLND